MTNVIEVTFGERGMPISDRETRLEQIARASANLLLGGVHGDVDDIEDNTDFIAEMFSRFDPPITDGEIDRIHKRAIKIAAEDKPLAKTEKNNG